MHLRHLVCVDELALHVHRRLLHARRLHFVRFHGREAHERELVHVGVKLSARVIGGLDKPLAHHVQRELCDHRDHSLLRGSGVEAMPEGAEGGREQRGPR